MAEHWCKEHQTVFFKKGTMKNYAHPILDEDGEPIGEWCNEPKQKVEESSNRPREELGMSKEDWSEKDRITRKSIERQTSLNAAIELAKIKGTDDTIKILATAKRFEAYLETGIDKEVKSKLIDEVKKLGTEIKEGE